MPRRPRRNHTPAFKARVAIAAIKGDRPHAVLQVQAGDKSKPTSTRTRRKSWHAREGVTGHGVRYVLLISTAALVVLFAAICSSTPMPKFLWLRGSEGAIQESSRCAYFASYAAASPRAEQVEQRGLGGRPHLGMRAEGNLVAILKSDRQAARDEKGDRRADAQVGRDHAPHLG